MVLRFAALAAALVVSSAGCSVMNPGGSCGDAIGCAGPMGCSGPMGCEFGSGSARGGGPGIFDKLGWTQRGCAECLDGCGSGCGPFGSGPACCPDGCQSNCLNRAMGLLLDCPGGCNQCGDQHYNFTPGPPTGQVAYPYYTTRGPRDFLMANPPSIGPR